MKRGPRTALAILASALLVAAVTPFLRDPSPIIPPFDEALFGEAGDGGSQILVIHENDLGQLRQILETTNKDRWPMKWAVSGILELRNNGTVVTTVEVFENPNGPGPLKISGTYYLGYNQESFRSILSRSQLQTTPATSNSSDQ